jgi:DNA-directed RNA polymerase subunit RPC12/RpoP
MVLRRAKEQGLIQVLPMVAVTEEVAMPDWVLHCVNCRKQFFHSKIEDTGLLSLHLESKPNFSSGGDELKCPHCGSKAFYQRHQLTYRA